MRYLYCFCIAMAMLAGFFGWSISCTLDYCGGTHSPSCAAEPSCPCTILWAFTGISWFLVALIVAIDHNELQSASKLLCGA